MARKRQTIVTLIDAQIWLRLPYSKNEKAEDIPGTGVLTPAALRQIKTLNGAGNILDVNRAYPGAVVGEAVGSSVGASGLGPLIGGAADRFGAIALYSSVRKKAARARIRKL
jgi:hypothetical protein